MPFISGNTGFRPILMMTLGKGKKYFYERLSEDGSIKNDPKFNTDPPFEDIFNFFDEGQLWVLKKFLAKEDK